MFRHVIAPWGLICSAHTHLLKTLAVPDREDEEDGVRVAEADLDHGGEVPGEGAAGVLNVQGELGGANLELASVHLLDCGL